MLAALHALLSARSALAVRGKVPPERVPAAGLVIPRDAEPGEPKLPLSPLVYRYWQHAEIKAVMQGVDRDAAFDTPCASIESWLAAVRALGGLRDRVEAARS